jgi:ribulose kinase
LPREPEAVLLGSAILAACAAGHFSSMTEAMARMSGVSTVIEPNLGARSFHEAKQRVFLRMHDDQLVYKREMSKSLAP